MIHFFVTFSNDASNSPFAHALKELGVEHRIVSGEILLRYRWRIWLLLVGLPRVVLVSARAAWQSLVRMRPVPDAVVINSHLEALVFRLVRMLARRRTRIYYLGLIFTRRRNPWLDRLRRAYLEYVFAGTQAVLCFSSLEQRRYDDLFPGARGKFRYMPYGLHLDGFDATTPFRNPADAPALSAGRSGRDYRTLFGAFAASGLPLRVVCDSKQALDGCPRADNIQVLRQCYDDAFSLELRGAGIVVVPLGVDDISAGQMVLIQAMAFSKPIVATRTPTIADYLTDGHDALLVPPGDTAALNAAVQRLRADPELARRLADNAHQSYLQRHSMRAYVGHIAGEVARVEAALAHG